jgi:MFS family permease
MGIKISKSRMVLYLIALFLTNVAVMADFVVIPAASDLFNAFGDQVNVVNFILSGPALICIISSLLTGKLLQFINKRTMLIIGYALFSVASIFGVVIINVYYIAVMRAFVGFAYGIVNVSAVSLIAETYIDEKKRSTMMGVYNAAMAAIGAFLGMAAGLFAAKAWQDVFQVYWVSVPILIIIILFVPSVKASKCSESSVESVSKKEKINLKTFVALNLGLLFFEAIFMVINFLVAVYVAENNIGDASVAGLLASLSTIGSACACLAFGFTYRKLGRGAVIPSFIILAIGYMILFVAPSLITAIIFCTLMGAAFGNGFSYYYMRGTVIVPPSKVSISMAIITSVNGIAMFISTYIATFIESVLNSPTLTGVMPVFAGLSAIGAVLAIALTIRNKNHPSEYQAETTI